MRGIIKWSHEPRLNSFKKWYLMEIKLKYLNELIIIIYSGVNK